MNQGLKTGRGGWEENACVAVERVGEEGKEGERTGERIGADDRRRSQKGRMGGGGSGGARLENDTSTLSQTQA